MTSENDGATTHERGAGHIAACRTVVLATIDNAHVPDASYSPFFINANDEVCVYISGLARHTRNLLAVDRASLMFIEDEAAAGEIYARRRVTMDCSARMLERDTSPWSEAMVGLGERYGEVVELIRPLMDFQMIAFTPSEARFVEGFGRAKTFSAERAVEMLKIARDLP